MKNRLETTMRKLRPLLFFSSETLSFINAVGLRNKTHSMPAQNGNSQKNGPVMVLAGGVIRPDSDMREATA